MCALNLNQDQVNFFHKTSDLLTIGQGEAGLLNWIVYFHAILFSTQYFLIKQQ